MNTVMPSQAQLKSLLEHYQNGRFSEAEKLAISLTQQFPKHQFGWKVLGALLKQNGRVIDSLTAMQKSVQLAPRDYEAHSNLGVTLQELGRLEEAEASCTRSIALKPDFAKAHSNLGVTLQEMGRLEEAEASYKQAIALKPDLAEAHSNLGVTLQEMGRLEEAEASYKQAIALKPDYPEAHFNLGNAQQELGRLEEAEASYKQALKIKPDYAEVYYNMGNALKDKGDLEAAIESYKQALKIKPNYAEVYYNMANALQDKGNSESAIDSYKHATKIKPDYAEAYHNMSLVNLSLQDFKAGWSLFEWRWKLKKVFGNPLKSSKPLWRPTKKQRVLLWCEQGIGDEIMFASLISDLYSSSSKLIVMTDKRLIPLFRRSFPDDIDFRPSNEVVSETEYDSQIPMGSVPLYFRQSIDSFKSSAQGWLCASSVKAKNLRSRLLSNDSETLIGISWHTTAHLSGAQNRLIPLNQIAQMLHAPKVRLVSLQYGDFVNDVKKLSTDYGIKVAQITEIDNMNDIDGLAALISACDRIVSIDNTTVHLAGALGKETKVLLPYACDWRWGQSSQDSYWYDSVQLYRQTKIGDWEHVIKQL
jgi:Flp pilus assembly protein TadD